MEIQRQLVGLLEVVVELLLLVQIHLDLQQLEVQAHLTQLQEQIHLTQVVAEVVV